MDLRELSVRTQIDRRKLRYCLDHGLVPTIGVEVVYERIGRYRQFGDDVGFGIVCAARLLELGLTHKRIQAFLTALLPISLPGPQGNETALAVIFERKYRAVATLGDGLHVRLEVASLNFDSGWISPFARTATGYVPVVAVTLDLGQIADQILRNV